MIPADLDSIAWRLMSHTKALESSFRAWSNGEVDEAVVSDCYVNLGNEFVSQRTRMEQGRVSTHDLIDVPTQLRGILEDALSRDASPAVAAEFDPQIRNVMKELFHQLKNKQMQMMSTNTPRAEQQNQASSNPRNARGASGSNVVASNVASNVATVPAGRTVTQAQVPAEQARQMNNPRSRPMHSHSHSTDQHPQNQHPHHHHAARARGGSSGGSAWTPTPSGPSYGHTYLASTHGTPSVASNSRQAAHSSAAGPPPSITLDSDHAGAMHQPPAIPAPKAPPSSDSLNEEDALSLLQRHGALERQASKRYSTRQISRMVNGSGIEQLPTIGVHKTFSTPEMQDSSVLKENFPRSDPGSQPPETPEQSVHRRASLTAAGRTSSGGTSSASASGGAGSSGSGSGSGSTGSGSGSAGSAGSSRQRASTQNRERLLSISGRSPSRSSIARRSVSAGSASASLLVPGSPGKPADDEFPVFLKLGNNIRKAVISKPPSIAAIRLRFVEVCAYVHSGDETFPEITLQDPKSGVNYEVTEATIGDVTEGSLLSLKVKTPEELSMQAELEEIKNSLKELTSKIGHSGSSAVGSGAAAATGGSGGARPGSGAGSINRGTSAYPNSPFTSKPSKFSSPVLTGEGRFKLEKPPREIPVDKVETVLREAAVIRQLSSKTIASLKQEVLSLKQEVKELSTSTANGTIADRRSMNLIKQQMEASSQELLSRMESLSDIIDAQRVGVGSHGVRYPQNELEKVRRQLQQWTTEFEQSEDFIENEKPVWKKTWQAELNNVIEDQEWLKSLDLLYSDLRSDLEQCAQTFELVCEANALPRKPGLRHGVPIAPPIKPGEEQAVADAVLQEITALNLNHEQRAEAAQRAERIHRAKLALRSEEFVDELNTFVSESKLKSNGGFTEVERRMREREEQARKLGEQSELEAKKNNELIKQERRAKRQAERKGKGSDKDADVFHDSAETPAEIPAAKAPAGAPSEVPSEASAEASAANTSVEDPSGPPAQ